MTYISNLAKISFNISKGDFFMIKERMLKNEVIETVEKNKEKQWYIIQTAANCEEAAKRNILIQLELNNATEKVPCILIPVKQVIEMKNGKKKVSNKKLYPGYVYILADLDETVWRSIKTASKVSRFVNEKDGVFPAGLKKHEVMSMLNVLDTEETAPMQKVTFNIEQPLRIINGPFAGFTGNVESVDYNKSKLKMNLVIFGRETPVELKFNEVSVEID